MIIVEKQDYVWKSGFDSTAKLNHRAADMIRLFFHWRQKDKIVQNMTDVITL